MVGAYRLLRKQTVTGICSIERSKRVQEISARQKFEIDIIKPWFEIYRHST